MILAIMLLILAAFELFMAVVTRKNGESFFWIISAVLSLSMAYAFYGGKL